MTTRAVLIVDDEKHVLSSIQRLLRKEPYTLHVAPSGKEGLVLLANHPVDLVISDQRMPTMTGVEFLQEVKQHYPDTIRVILSGYADVNVIVDAINKGEVYRFLPKPWNADELKAALRQCLEHHDILCENRGLVERVQAQNEELSTLNGRLEEMVQQRTKSLQLSQEVLEKLPVSVIGIGLEREIVLTNEAATRTISSLAEAIPGASMEGILPPNAVQAVEHCLESGEEVTLPPFAWNDDTFRLCVRPLKNGEMTRGCILVFERERIFEEANDE